MSGLSTPDLLNRAAAALLDPEQTAVAPEVAGPLSDLLASLPGVAPTPTARQAAVMILDHEHTRITNPPQSGNDSVAEVIDQIATSFAHGAVPGLDDHEAEDAAFRFLIQCRDDIKGGRQL